MRARRLRWRRRAREKRVTSVGTYAGQRPAEAGPRSRHMEGASEASGSQGAHGGVGQRRGGGGSSEQQRRGGKERCTCPRFQWAKPSPDSRASSG